jgi:hypothetical protein
MSITELVRTADVDQFEIKGLAFFFFCEFNLGTKLME